MVHKPAASPQKSAPRKRASRKDVPPQTSTTLQDLAAAEQRKLTLQTEAAINLAVGLVMTRLSPSCVSIVIRPDEISEFAKTHRVTQEIGSDGTATLRVEARA